MYANFTVREKYFLTELASTIPSGSLNSFSVHAHLLIVATIYLGAWLFNCSSLCKDPGKQFDSCILVIIVASNLL